MEYWNIGMLAAIRLSGYHHSIIQQVLHQPPPSGQSAVAMMMRNDRSALTLSTLRRAVTGLDGTVTGVVNVNAVASPGTRPSPISARSDSSALPRTFPCWSRSSIRISSSRWPRSPVGRRWPAPRFVSAKATSNRPSSSLRIRGLPTASAQEARHLNSGCGARLGRFTPVRGDLHAWQPHPPRIRREQQTAQEQNRPHHRAKI
jgi:hypothetical protein